MIPKKTNACPSSCTFVAFPPKYRLFLLYWSAGVYVHASPHGTITDAGYTNVDDGFALFTRVHPSFKNASYEKRDCTNYNWVYDLCCASTVDWPTWLADQAGDITTTLLMSAAPCTVDIDELLLYLFGSRIHELVPIALDKRHNPWPPVKLIPMDGAKSSPHFLPARMTKLFELMDGDTTVRLTTARPPGVIVILWR